LNKKNIILFLVFTILFNSFIIISSESAPTQRVLQQGASGNDVTELQNRLKQMGYYNMNIDGKFGWGTYWAVRNFQKDFGLKVDGIAGNQTWTILRNNTYTPSSSTTRGFSQEDINLLVHLVNGEARGESYIGQVAIVSVVLNRLKSSHFPNSISGVIFEPRAFTAVEDGQMWLTPRDPNIRKAVRDAINGWDPSSGALYYFNPNTATSVWIWSRPQIKQIGKHIFCR
jgi:N-acetylmuramoyl-L-alanine amidase